MRRILFAAVILAGCSSSTGVTGPDPNPKPQQSPGDDITKPSVEKPVTNPDGVPYPSADLGYKARAGSAPGNRIPNFRFRAWVNLNPAMQTQSSGDMTILQLADLFDPGAKKLRVIHIVVAARWCGPCNQEAEFMVQNKVADDLLPLGAVVIGALTDGAVAGVPADESDLTWWITTHKVNFTEVLDGDNKLGFLWKAAAIPENITIDARSMEILSAKSGFSQTIKEDIQGWVTWTMNTPAKQ